MKSKLILLLFIVIAILRLLRPELTGFYFDQGRDALVIWDLIKNGRVFLIGPTTGIEGIFLGPAFYYLLAPIYWLGGGNPIWPIQFLGILNIIGLFLLYKLGEKHFSKGAGLLAVIMAGFSYYNITDHRWLSNPNPLTLTSIVIFALMSRLISGEKKWFPLIGFLLGLGLQFEAASAVFFLPATLIILLVFFKKIKMDWKNFLLGGMTFGATLVPQLWFNFRHQNILVQSFERFLIAEKSFTQSPLAILPTRLNFYFETFTNHLTLASTQWRWLFLLIVLIAAIRSINILWKNDVFKLGLIWFLTPVVILLLYTGNNGYVWGYYFTGIYPVMYLLLGAILIGFSKYRFGNVFLVIIMTLLASSNLLAIRHYFSKDITKTDAITLGGSLAVVDWVYKDAGETPFNVDVYVPPVIPHAYNYLFKWRGLTKYHRQPNVENVNLLYTPFEPDGPHPERLNKWLVRQNAIGNVESEFKIGALTIQKRTRVLYEK